MGHRIVPPKSIKWSAYKQFGWGALGLFAHSLQCGQRWVFLVRVGRRRFGYRTRGDANPRILTHEDAGWYLPWKHRVCSGRG